MPFTTIEEALADACKAQWESSFFDAERDVSLDVFNERKMQCTNCVYLDNSNHCEASSDFMPIITRSKYEFCVLEKWIEIEKAPDIPLPLPEEINPEEETVTTLPEESA